MSVRAMVLKFFAILAACSAVSAHAAVRLGAPFGDHMVLPRGVPVTLWGTGAPGGDTVRVHFAGQSVTAHSDWQGRWQVQLAPMQAGGPYQMNVEVGGVGPVVPSSAANSTGGLELNDVMVGDVITPDASMKKASQTQNEGRAVSPVAYALVRVYRVRVGEAAGHWVSVWQGRVPEGTAALFQAGQTYYESVGVPTGVMETAVLLRCQPFHILFGALTPFRSGCRR